jgi:hypothetical protein
LASRSRIDVTTQKIPLRMASGLPASGGCNTSTPPACSRRADEDPHTAGNRKSPGAPSGHPGGTLGNDTIRTE